MEGHKLIREGAARMLIKGEIGGPKWLNWRSGE